MVTSSGGSGSSGGKPSSGTGGAGIPSSGGAPRVDNPNVGKNYTPAPSSGGASYAGGSGGSGSSGSSGALGSVTSRPPSSRSYVNDRGENITIRDGPANGVSPVAPSRTTSGQTVRQVAPGVYVTSGGGLQSLPGAEIAQERYAQQSPSPTQTASVQTAVGGAPAYANGQQPNFSSALGGSTYVPPPAERKPYLNFTPNPNFSLNTGQSVYKEPTTSKQNNGQRNTSANEYNNLSSRNINYLVRGQILSNQETYKNQQQLTATESRINALEASRKNFYESPNYSEYARKTELLASLVTGGAKIQRIKGSSFGEPLSKQLIITPTPLDNRSTLGGGTQLFFEGTFNAPPTILAETVYTPAKVIAAIDSSRLPERIALPGGYAKNARTNLLTETIITKDAPIANPRTLYAELANPTTLINPPLKISQALFKRTPTSNVPGGFFGAAGSRVEQGPLSILPGGTPVNQEGVAAGLNAITGGAVKGYFDFNVARSTPSSVSVRPLSGSVPDVVLTGDSVFGSQVVRGSASVNYQYGPFGIFRSSSRVHVESNVIFQGERIPSTNTFGVRVESQTLVPTKSGNQFLPQDFGGAYNAKNQVLFLRDPTGKMLIAQQGKSTPVFFDGVSTVDQSPGRFIQLQTNQQGYPVVQATGRSVTLSEPIDFTRVPYRAFQTNAGAKVLSPDFINDIPVSKPNAIVDFTQGKVLKNFGVQSYDGLYNPSNGKITVSRYAQSPTDVILHEATHKADPFISRGRSMSPAMLEQIKSDFAQLNGKTFSKVDGHINKYYPESQRPAEFLAYFAEKNPSEISRPTTRTGEFLKQQFTNQYGSPAPAEFGVIGGPGQERTSVSANTVTRVFPSGAANTDLFRGGFQLAERTGLYRDPRVVQQAPWSERLNAEVDALARNRRGTAGFGTVVQEQVPASFPSSPDAVLQPARAIDLTGLPIGKTFSPGERFIFFPTTPRITDTRSVQRNAATVFDPSQTSVTKTTSVQRPDQGPRQIPSFIPEIVPEQTPRITPTFVPRITTDTVQRQIPDTPFPRTGTPPFPFSPGVPENPITPQVPFSLRLPTFGRPESFSSRDRGPGKGSFRYVPSLTAGVYQVKGPRQKGFLTGVSLRPIVSVPSRQRRLPKLSPIQLRRGKR